MGQSLELPSELQYIWTFFKECYSARLHNPIQCTEGVWCRNGGGAVDWGGDPPGTGRRAEQRVQYRSPPLSLPASRQTFKSGLRYYNKEGPPCRNNAKHFNPQIKPSVSCKDKKTNWDFFQKYLGRSDAHFNGLWVTSSVALTCLHPDCCGKQTFETVQRETDLLNCGMYISKLWHDIDFSISAVNVQSLKFLHCSSFLQTGPSVEMINHIIKTIPS